MKYYVFMVLIQMVSVECPDAVDEFGRTSANVCAVNHVEWQEKVFHKVFEDRDDAFSLYERALREEDVKLVVIDSIVR